MDFPDAPMVKSLHFQRRAPGGPEVFLEGSVKMDMTCLEAAPSMQNAGESRLEMEMEIPGNWFILWVCGDL